MVKRYEQSFKETLVELYDSGQSVPSLSSEYGIAQTTLYKWINKYSKKGGQEYNQLLERYKIKHSYSRKGYPYHNASLESRHSHLKRDKL